MTTSDAWGEQLNGCRVRAGIAFKASLVRREYVLEHDDDKRRIMGLQEQLVVTRAGIAFKASASRPNSPGVCYWLVFEMRCLSRQGLGELPMLSMTSYCFTLSETVHNPQGHHHG